jgi:hypothetical protein
MSFAKKVSRLTSSLCNLCVLCVSVVMNESFNPRDEVVELRRASSMSVLTTAFRYLVGPL